MHKGNFAKTGKVREFYPKYWKNRKKNSWVREICQPVIVKTLQIWYHTLSKKRTFKKYWKTVKNTGKVGEICQSEKVGAME